MIVDDRAIVRAKRLATPLDRLRELAPRLLEVLPDTIGGCAERLDATRQEIEDAHQFAINCVAMIGGRLVYRR